MRTKDRTIPATLALIGVLASSLAPALGAAATFEENAARVLAPGFEASPLLRLQLSKELLRQAQGLERYRQAVGPALDSYHLASDASAELLKTYQGETDSLKTYVADVRATGVALGAGMAPSGQQFPVANAILGSAYEKLVAGAIEGLDEDRREKLDELFAYRMGQIRALDANRYRELLDGAPVEKVREAVLGSTAEFFADPVWNGVSLPDRDVLAKHLLTDVPRSLENERARAAAGIEVGLVAAQSAVQQAVAVGQSFSRFASETQDLLKRLQAGQNAVVSVARQLNEHLMRDVKDPAIARRGVAILQDVVFGNMSPREQLDAIRSNLFAGLEDAARDRLKAELKPLAQVTEKLPASIEKYFSGGMQLLEIAGKLGVNPKTLDKVRKGIEVAHAAVEIGVAIASGNPIAALGALGSAFGIGGDGGAAARHAEIMARLDALLEGQRVIIENQKIIIENQQRMMQAIADLGKALEESHRLLSNQVSQIQADVRYGNSLLGQVLGSDLKACESWDSHWSTPAPAPGASRDYAELSRHYAAYSDAFSTCVKGLEGVMPDSVHGTIGALHARTYPSGAEYIDRIYRPVVRAHLRLNPFGSADKLLSALTLPADRLGTPVTGGVGRDERFTRDLPPYQTPTGVTVPAEETLTELLMPELVMRTVEHALKIAPLFEYLDGPGAPRLLPLDQLLRDGGSEVVARGVGLLQDAIGLIDLAVAHQNVLAGEVIAPRLAADVLQGLSAPGDASARHRQLARTQVDCATGDAYFNAVCLIESDPVLGENVVLDLIRDKVAQAGYNAGPYLTAWDDPDALQLRYVLPGLPLKRIAPNEGRPYWALVLTGTNGQPLELALPTPYHVRTGELTRTAATSQLLELRRQVIARIADLGLREKLASNPALGQALNEALFRR